MEDLLVSQVSLANPQTIGKIHDNGMLFSYDESYLASHPSIPLSLSLPFTPTPFPKEAFRPYFEGLLAEGSARQSLASELQLKEDDWLGMLEACGRDCLGDVIIETPHSSESREQYGYESIDVNEVRAMMRTLPRIAKENAGMRLSLAGAQGKVGLAHNPLKPADEGWLKPHGLAATTHILKTSHLRDIPEVEFLCMKAASACGVKTASVHLLDFGMPILVVERFDRRATFAQGHLVVERLHQEDLCQAFGMTSASKYAEMPGGSVRSIADLIRRQSARPAKDIAQLARVLSFNYVIGNCDAHLKNFSLLYSAAARAKEPVIELAPAYDLVSTTYYPRYSRDLAMTLGDARTVDKVVPGSFSTLAEHIGMKASALRSLAKPIADNVVEAIGRAGSGSMGSVLESTPYVADDLINDIAPRLEILRAFCEGSS